MADLIRQSAQWTLVDKLICLLQIAHVLNYCNRLGLIAHQDLKPANIFFDNALRKYRIEQPNYMGLIHEIAVADFGLADAFRDIGVNSGSRPYMAPEQYLKGELIDGSKIDVFALGVIAFECLTDGLHPIGERTSDAWPNPAPDMPKKWRHEDVWKNWARNERKQISLQDSGGIASAELEELIRISLASNPAERPSMSEFEAGLQAVLKTVDPDRAAGLQMQLNYFDGFTSGESGWPYLEERLREMRQFYAQWGR